MEHKLSNHDKLILATIGLGLLEIAFQVYAWV
jgi:hypothetical protein